MNDLLDRIISTDAIQISNDPEEFTLKSGQKSNIYINLRELNEHPNIIDDLANQINMLINAHYDYIAGIPYGAIPIATMVSVKSQIPLLMIRKEGAKKHGVPERITNKCLVKILLIEDVTTTGSSISETVDSIRETWPNHAFSFHRLAIVDRGQTPHKIKVSRNRFTLSEGTTFCLYTLADINSCRIALEACAKCINNRLSQIINDKKSRICLAADLTTTHALYDLIHKVGKHICILKTHIDILEDFNPIDTPKQLRALAKKYNFLIMEDRKFADIGNTMINQYAHGIYRIGDWADIITIHPLVGKDSINALIKYNTCISYVLIADMSSNRTRLETNDVEKCITDNCLGVVTQHPIIKKDLPGIKWCFTPGIKLKSDSMTDNKGQQYRTPQDALEAGADILIVGRDIYNDPNPVDKIKKYF